MTSNERGRPPANVEELRQQRQEVLEHVLDLLEKAEERGAEEPENETKWRKILNHLWKSLDEAKARLAEAEALVDREQRKAAQPSQLTPAAEIPPPVSATLHELGGFTTFTRPMNGGSPGRSFQERRRQILFRCAVDKVKDHRIHAMTLEELDFAIDFFQSLEQRHEASAEHEKVRAFLAKTDISIGETCAEMRRRRAQLYVKKTR